MPGIMAKVEDIAEGKVHKNGRVQKIMTQSDVSRLQKGAEISRNILVNAGVRPETVITTKPRGAHPGGTAAIGEIVDKNLETQIKGLFICDASVLPVSPGLPPILTIIALSKKFVKRI